MNIFSKISVFALSRGSDGDSFWQAVADYVEKAMDFENIGMGSGLVSIPLLFLGIFIGLCVAVIASVYNKRVLGNFVRDLIRENCLSPEDARDLDYLNYIYKGYIRNAVSRGTNLRRVVKCREEEEHDRKQAELVAEAEARGEKAVASRYKVDPYMDHFYIPAELKETAEKKFEKRGSTWAGSLVAIILLAVFFFAALLLFPQIMKLVDNFIGIIKG